MTNIKIPHEVIREIGKSFANEAIEAEARVAKLNTSLRALDWAGATHSAFFQAWEEALQFKKMYHEELRSINLELTAIADRFQTADEARLGG